MSRPTSAANLAAQFRPLGSRADLDREPKPTKPKARKGKNVRVRVEPATDPWTGERPKEQPRTLDVLDRVELEAYRAQEKREKR